VGGAVHAASVPKLFNLRTDPYERADVTSNTYYDFLLHNMYFLYAAQAAAQKFAETFKEFPPAQKPGSFTIDDAMKKMSEGHQRGELKCSLPGNGGPAKSAIVDFVGCVRVRLRSRVPSSSAGGSARPRGRMWDHGGWHEARRKTVFPAP
jgi:hypothetical protein